MGNDYVRYELACISNVAHPRLEWKREVKRLLDKYGFDNVLGACYRKGVRFVTEEDIVSYIAETKKQKDSVCAYFSQATYGSSAFCDARNRYAFCGGREGNCRCGCLKKKVSELFGDMENNTYLYTIEINKKVTND